MQIIEYDPKYDENIKELLIELHNYLIDIDNWHALVMKPEFKEGTFNMDLKKVKNQEGKIYLAKDEENIVGLIICIVDEKDEEDILTNDCARTGVVLELVVNYKYRRKRNWKNFTTKSRRIL